MKKLILVLALFLLSHISTSQAFAQSTWKISSFDSAVQLEKTGQITVTETIFADFGNISKHGIYRDLPYVYQSDKEKIYTPGYGAPYPFSYRNFSGYYYRSWSFLSTPGYYTTTKTYTIETNVYSIKEDRIIWSGLTETTNVDGVKAMTEEVVKVVYRKMVKEGFITNN